MNERFRLNSTQIRAWLVDTGRKQTYLQKVLKVSRWTVHRMLNEEHIPDDPEVTRSLAREMGVDERQLILPRESEVKITA